MRAFRCKAKWDKFIKTATKKWEVKKHFWQFWYANITTLNIYHLNLNLLFSSCLVFFDAVKQLITLCTFWLEIDRNDDKKAQEPDETQNRPANYAARLITWFYEFFCLVNNFIFHRSRKMLSSFYSCFILKNPRGDTLKCSSDRKVSSPLIGDSRNFCLSRRK